MTVKTYLLSFPERLIRSALGLGAGVAREVGEVALPDGIRRSQLYQHLVDATLRFLIEQVGGVEGVYTDDGALPENFLVRRTAGNAVEVLGIVAFRASPVWILAALADLCGMGRHLIPEMADALKAQDLLEHDAEFTSVDQMLDGLERTSSRLAATINTPPLDVAGLRKEWEAIREEARSLQPASLPSRETISNVWAQLKTESARQNRSVFETSSMMAVSAARALPDSVRWFSASARAGATRTGHIFATALLDHYQRTLSEMRQVGYLAFTSRQFRPYVRAAVAQFSPKRSTLTQRLVERFRVARSGRGLTVFLVSSAVALNCALAARAQEPQQPRYTERVEVARLIVDARVVDDVGNPVLGLGADDFKVTIDGTPVRVESALWAGGGEPQPGVEPLEATGFAGTASPVSLGRLIVFLFQKDLEPSRIVGLMRMLVEAQGFLDTLSPHDRVAVLSFDSHLKIWLDFTSDRERLRRVLSHGILFENPPPVQEASLVSLVARLDPTEGRHAYSIEKALQLIAEALRRLPGSKSIVLVGHGFGRLGPLGVAMEHDYAPARNALLAARASVFSLDVTNADYHSLEAGLQLVSEQTGGFFARTHVFSAQAMRRLAGALAGYYVLFVEKPEVGRETHKVEVQLAGRKGTVLARSGYVD